MLSECLRRITERRPLTPSSIRGKAHLPDSPGKGNARVLCSSELDSLSMLLTEGVFTATSIAQGSNY